MRNSYDSFCFNCGNHVPKGAGHPEKTNHSHTSRGIHSKWVIRCKDCVRLLDHPKAVERLLKEIKGDSLNGLSTQEDVWFDSKGKGYVTIEIARDNSKSIKLTTTVSSNKPEPSELEEKRNNLKRYIDSIKVTL